MSKSNGPDEQPEGRRRKAARAGHGRTGGNPAADPVRLLLHGFYGAGNLGDEAILAGLVDQIHERVEAAELMVISQDAQETERLHPVRAVDRHDLHAQSAALSQADLLVFGGGGLCNDYWSARPADVLDDAWGGLGYWLRIPVLAALHEVPVVVCAQGVGPLVDLEARRMVRAVFNQAVDITVRDTHSADLLRDLGVTPPVAVAADPAFSLTPDEDEAASLLASHKVPVGERPILAVSVRPFASVTPDRLQLLARCAGRFARAINAHVLILPFCTRGPNADADACRQFADALPSDITRTLVEAAPSVRGALALIGRTDLVLGMRYHASVFAVHQHVPVVPLVYDLKVQALFDDLGIDGLAPLDVNALTPDKTSAALDRAWEDRDRLRAALSDAADGLVARAATAADRLCDLASAAREKPASDQQRRSLWNVRSSIKSARTQLAELQAQILEAQKQIDEHRQSEAQAIDKQRELAEQFSNARQDVVSAREEIAQAARAAAEAKRSVAAAESRAAAAVAEVERAKRLAAEAAVEAEQAKRLVAEAREQAAIDVAQADRRASQADERAGRAIHDAQVGIPQAIDAARQAERLAAEADARAEALTTQNSNLQAQKDDLESRIQQTKEALSRSQSALTKADDTHNRLRMESEEYKRKLRFANERSRDLAEQLQQIWESKGWQLLNRAYHNRVIGGTYRAAKWVLPVRFKEWAKRRLRRKAGRAAIAPPVEPVGTVPAASEARAESPTSADTTAEPARAPQRPRSNAAVIEDLREFLERVNESDRNDLVVFVAGVKYVQSEGQRVTQIVREFIRNGVPVLMLYFRWQSEYHQPVPVSEDPLFFQLPLDLFEPQRKMVMERPFRPSLRKTCVFEFPHTLTFQWVNEFSLSGWKTVYDIIDDWEEFHEAGKAVWYEPAVEQYLCANAGAVAAIVPLLADKARAWVPDLDVAIIPNGVSPDSFDMTQPREPLECGQVTVGYFGYLAQAWFDWEMVARIAAGRPDWQFHIIGYGEKVPVKLTDNVQLLGKVAHHLLYGYTQNWDVGIVPFKPTTLSKGADPIKVYEYLTLGLPVVATDIPHLRDYPGVYVAESAEQFDRHLETAARQGAGSDEVKTFLKACTWYQRGLDLIEAAQRGQHGDVLTSAVVGSDAT